MPLWDDRDLVDGFSAGERQRHQRVAGFVIRHHPSLLRVQDPVFLFQACHDALDGASEIVHGGRVDVAPRRQDRGFVDQIGQLGTAEPGRQRCDLLQVHIVA